jgi:anti-sigma factor RsiW
MSPKNPSESELHAYLDGELVGERRREVEEWLVLNPGDAERIAAWAAQRDALHAAFDPVLGEKIPERTSLLAGGRERGIRRRHAVAALLALAIFSSGFGSAAMLLAMRKPAAEATAARAGLQAHRLYTPERLHPVEVAATDSDHLATWLSRRVGVEIRLPQIGIDGVTLLGGRLVPVGMQAGALLMYQGADGSRYTLLVAKSGRLPSGGGAPEPGKSYVEDGNFGAWVWRKGEREFVLSGPAGAEGLAEIRAALGEPAI